MEDSVAAKYGLKKGLKKNLKAFHTIAKNRKEATIQKKRRPDSRSAAETLKEPF